MSNYVTVENIYTIIQSQIKSYRFLEHLFLQKML